MNNDTTNLVKWCAYWSEDPDRRITFDGPTDWGAASDLGRELLCKRDGLDINDPSQNFWTKAGTYTHRVKE